MASKPPPEALARPLADALTDPEASGESLEQLIAQYTPEAAPVAGEIRQGLVVSISRDGVVVDLGAKTEGLVPREELTDAEGNPWVQPGDRLDILVQSQETHQGYLPVSAERAEQVKVWDELARLQREERKLRTRVLERIKGGLLVELQLPALGVLRRPVRGFLPGSQVDLRPVRNWEGLLGRELTCRIIKLSRRRGNIVVSRRLLLEEEQARRQKLLQEELKEGAIVKGTVKSITDYGVFVDLGGIDGLLHITDLSWGRVAHPADVLRLDDELRVKVLKFDRAKMRLSLGLKQLQPDPWTTAAEKYPVGTRVRGRVINLVEFGAFVELEPGLEGLIHISEMSWTKRIRHPRQVVNLGDRVEAVVLDLQPAEQRLALGLRQTEPDPFLEVAARYPEGSLVRGRVRNLTDFGAFIEIEPGVEGLLHVSDLSWNKRIKRPEQLLARGQEVEAKVLKVDVLNRRLSLGMKQLQPDIWERYFARARLGDVVRGRVLRLTRFGAFVELEDGVEGLCHISELEETPAKIRGDRRQQEPASKVEVGKEYEFKIIKLNPAQRRIGLSLKAMLSEMERHSLEQYRASRPSPTTTIGEIVSQKVGTKKRTRA